MTTSETWKQAERAAFNYFIKIFEATEGKNLFIGSAPVGSFDTMDFGFVGGPRSDLARSTGGIINVNSWIVEARLRGVFSTRDKAIEAIGVIMDNLPAGDIQRTQDAGRDIDYVQTMRLDRVPELGSGWVSFTNTRREQLVANIDAPLEVVICTS